MSTPPAEAPVNVPAREAGVDDVPGVGSTIRIGWPLAPPELGVESGVEPLVPVNRAGTEGVVAPGCAGLEVNGLDGAPLVAPPPVLGAKPPGGL